MSKGEKGWTRREVVKTFVVTAGAVVAAPHLSGCSDSGGTETPTTYSFPQSIASGDPRTDSIVLWTRVQSSATGDVPLAVEIATDEAFQSRVTVTPATVTAAASADFTVRVKVTGLTAGTRYFYRFRAGDTTTTNVGRFKTAADAAVDAPVRFALLSCQDFVGKFYNTLTELLASAQDDLDFVLFIGDYVYETTGDPQFQSQSGRKVTFSDQAGAIQLGTSPNFFYAAKSLSNYRELYKTYRGDATLQKVHEKFPFIVIWDDHEFSDDCWQDVGTYTDGVKDETDKDRRQNAEQAFFEFQPVALDSEATGALSLTRDQLFPNTKLYRDFRFGKHVHLLLTDYRSFRPDHPVPEEGCPGTVVVPEAALKELLGVDTIPSSFPAYVNLDDASFAELKSSAKATLITRYA